MAYRLEWSPRAIDDVESIAIYIAADSTEYAKTVVKKLLRKQKV
jgi:plasmid stabilization system protein ParE